jgi:Ca-activated chloride channel family protein
MITLDPVLPPALLLLLAAALGAFVLWRLVAERRTRPAWALRLVAVLLLLLVGLRPVIPAEVDQRPTSSGGLEVYIAVDTTSSMAAEDWNGPADATTRLDGVKADIAEMAGALPGAGFSLITFDGQAVQRVPLTSDGSALLSASDVLTQEITAYSTGSSIDEPVELLARVLGAAEEENPDQQRVLFYLGDGEQTVEAEPGGFADLAQYISGGAVLGYGTIEGAQMRQFGGFSNPFADGGGQAPGAAQPDAVQPDYIQDYSGGAATPAISRIDEENLGQVAEQLGVPYLHRSAGTGIGPVLDGLDVGDVSVTEGSQTAAVEFYWIPAALLGLIALSELLRLSGALIELRGALRGTGAPASPTSTKGAGR